MWKLMRAWPILLALTALIGCSDDSGGGTDPTACEMACGDIASCSSVSTCPLHGVPCNAENLDVANCILAKPCSEHASCFAPTSDGSALQPDGGGNDT